MAGSPLKAARLKLLNSEGFIDHVCELLIEGKSLSQIARESDPPMFEGQIRAWIKADPERSARYARARVEQAEGYAEEIIEISDQSVTAKTNEEMQAAKLRVDSRKWVASKLLPKIYGDRVQQDVTIRGLESVIGDLEKE